jgi:RNA-binding proteins (RRM domain)
MNIYVGNMSYDTTEAELRTVCEGFGKVESINIIKDKFSGQSKGFAFVEIPSKADGQAAIDGLNDKELNGRSLNVNEARPRTENPGGGKGGYGGGTDRYGGGRGEHGISKGEYSGSKGGYRGGNKKEGYSGGREGRGR